MKKSELIKVLQELPHDLEVYVNADGTLYQIHVATDTEMEDHQYCSAFSPAQLFPGDLYIMLGVVP
jgi:hypothetical protein